MLIIKVSYKGMINEKKKCIGIKKNLGLIIVKRWGGGGKIEGWFSVYVIMYF